MEMRKLKCFQSTIPVSDNVSVTRWRHVPCAIPLSGWTIGDKMGRYVIFTFIDSGERLVVAINNNQ